MKNVYQNIVIRNGKISISYDYYQNGSIRFDLLKFDIPGNAEFEQ